MALAAFHCSNAQGGLIDARRVEVEDIFEARDYAKAIARSLMSTPNLRDWRKCCLHVSDDLGQEILVVPFSSILGKPH